ncbi:MAG: hypothetical protein OFPI_26920 [Osedax symbiont Rs2]|nr:MAG: hypothetical protein OFPI_26920 [Osedax symbiont Rs2]
MLSKELTKNSAVLKWRGKAEFICMLLKASLNASPWWGLQRLLKQSV